MLSPRLLELRRSLKALCFGLLVFGVLLSGSRAAWASLAVGIVVVLAVLSLRRGAGRRAGAAFALVLVAVALTTVLVSVTDTANLLGDRAGAQAYDTDRFETQREGIALAEQYPVGIGPGQFDVYSPVAIHSLYLRAAVEQGVLGLVALVTFALATLMVAGRNAFHGRSTMGIGSAALLGAWVGLLVNSLVIDSLHWRHFWVVAALVWAGAMHRTESNAAATPRPG
jgi:O-antigen ligase